MSVSSAGPCNLSASGGSSFGVLGDGTVWTWGFVRPWTVADGQSGTTRSQPVRIPFLSDIRAVADASTVAYALDGQGRVWSWGQNTYGALGDGSPTTTIREVPAVIAGLPPIRSISASAHLAVAIAMDGSVWSWGRNTAGQVGDGTTVTRTQSAQILPPFFGSSPICVQRFCSDVTAATA